MALRDEKWKLCRRESVEYTYPFPDAYSAGLPFCGSILNFVVFTNMAVRCSSTHSGRINFLTKQYRLFSNYSASYKSIMCNSGLIYTRINNTIICYDLGMSRIPPIPPQFSFAVGFDFVGKFCAGSSGAVHSVFLIDVYLDLENPGGSGFSGGGEQKGY